MGHDSANDLRKCSKCHESKPLADFFSRGGKQERRRYQCRSCYLAYQRAYYKAHPEQHIERYHKKKSDPAGFMLRSVRNRAYRNKIPFDLRSEDIFIPEFCPILGIKLTAPGSGYSDASPSLDRLDPNKGYVRGNVAVISMRANWMKSNATADEHERIAAWMRAHSQEPTEKVEEADDHALH